MMTAVRVMLADDHELVLAGLKALLLATGRIDVVGEATSVDEALELAQETQPEIILMDYDFGRAQRDGLDALGALRAAQPETRVIMLTQCMALDRPCLAPARACGTRDHATGHGKLYV